MQVAEGGRGVWRMGGRGEGTRVPSENGRHMTCLSLPLALTIIQSQIKCALYNYTFFASNHFGYLISLIGNRLHPFDDQRLTVGWSWGVVIFSAHCRCCCWLEGEARSIVDGVATDTDILLQANHFDNFGYFTFCKITSFHRLYRNRLRF